MKKILALLLVACVQTTFAQEETENLTVATATTENLTREIKPKTKD